MRKTGGESLDALAASIRGHGLLHSLTVTQETDAEGNVLPRYRVIAGGRRLAALAKLAKEKAIPKNYPVPCGVQSENNLIPPV